MWTFPWCSQPCHNVGNIGTIEGNIHFEGICAIHYFCPLDGVQWNVNDFKKPQGLCDLNYIKMVSNLIILWSGGVVECNSLCEIEANTDSMV